MNKPRILFVDDDPAVLEGLENRMRTYRRRWHLRFSLGGEAARQALAVESCDVVVANVRTSDDRGLAFIDEVAREHPDSLRFILSGGIMRSEDFLRLALVAHQVLPMPCAPQQLEEAIENATLLRRLVDVAGVRKLVQNVRALPVVPETYAALQALLADPDCDLREVSALVSREVATSARLLQLVNSAVFARRQPARTVHDAVSALGLSTLQSLVLSTSIFETSPHRDPRRSRAVSKLLTASQATAEVAAQIAEPPLRATAYAAGLLHDIGRLVMLDVAGYVDLMTEMAPELLLQEEQRLYGTSHPDVGAYLLSLWGLPGDLIRAVALHHTSLDEVEEPLAALVAVGALLARSEEVPRAWLKRERLEPLGIWRGVQAYLNGPPTRETA